MDRSPEVTVVVPTHNRSGLLPLTLESVLWQLDVDLEVIVVDDGSTDETPRVTAAVEDPRVRSLRQETPLGVSVARNRGAAEGSGEWLAFIDDDDLWSPDKLACQLEACRQTELSWAYVGQVNVTLDLRVIGGAPPLAPEQLVHRLPEANAVPGGGSGVLVRTDLFRDENGFDEGYRHFADWDLWLRLLRRGPPACVPRPLVGYRIHSGARSMDTKGMVAELDMIEDRHGTRVDRIAFYRHIAHVAQRGSRHLEALGYLLHAIAQGPRGHHSRDPLSDLRLAGHVAMDAFRARLGPWVPDHVRELRVKQLPRGPFQAWQDEGRQWVDQLQKGR